MDANTDPESERALQLRSIELQQINAATLLKIAATLNEIRDVLRKQSRQRNGIGLTNLAPFEGKRRSEESGTWSTATIRRIHKIEPERKIKMKCNEVFPSRWLRAADLEPDGEKVTIRKVTMEEIGEERERKPIMAFDETDKELVVNVTNWNSIVELTGEEDSDDWLEHVIKLVRVKVQYGAKTVDAIRIEAPDKPVRRNLGKTKRVAKQQNAEEDEPPIERGNHPY